MVGGLLLIAGLQIARSALASKALDHAPLDASPFLGSLLVGVIGLVSEVTGFGGDSSRAACAVSWVGNHADRRHGNVTEMAAVCMVAHPRQHKRRKDAATEASHLGHEGQAYATSNEPRKGEASSGA